MGGKINYIQFTVTQRGQTQIKKKQGQIKKKPCTCFFPQRLNKNWETVRRANLHVHNMKVSGDDTLS